MDYQRARSKPNPVIDMLELRAEQVTRTRNLLELYIETHQGLLSWIQGDKEGEEVWRVADIFSLIMES